MKINAAAMAETHHNRTLPAGAGSDGGRSSAILHRMSANTCREMATSAIWKGDVQPWLTIFAPILMSFSLSVARSHRQARFA
jgi:hypothetical protein